MGYEPNVPHSLRDHPAIYFKYAVSRITPTLFSLGLQKYINFTRIQNSFCFILFLPNHPLRHLRCIPHIPYTPRME